MAKQMDNLTWTNVDMDRLSRPLQKAWQEYRTAQQIANNKRDAFAEAAAVVMAKAGQVPEGMETVFSFKFGRLGVAFRPVTGKASKSAKAPLVLG
jgi:hypothetical protein